MSVTPPLILLGQVFTRKLVAFVGNTLLVYDYLLTLHLEVAHIWNERWTAVKILFLVNRYGNLIGQTFILLEETGYLSHGSRQFCVGFQLYCPFFSVFSGESIRLFVVMRACAILRFRRTVASLVNALYVLYAVGLVVFAMCSFLLHIDAVEFEYLKALGICISFVPPNIWMIWFLALFLDGFILALVFCSLSWFIKGSGHIYPSQFVRLLARDALLFYLAALFNVTLSVVCWTTYSLDPRNMVQILITYPFLSVIGQRLALNLRGFRAQVYSTHDLSQEVDRQIAAMADMELDELTRWTPIIGGMECYRNASLHSPGGTDRPCQ